MRRRNVATVIGFAGFALIVVALVGSLGAFVYREMGAMRQRDALNLLNYFQQAMVTKLYDEVSPVDDLAAAFEVDPDDEAWFPRVAGELLEREEVSYVAYVRGDTMAYAYPEEEFGDTVGDDLTSFSYVYTLAKWTDGFVVESSVELSSGENVFLFVRPVNVGGSYYGEAVVGVKESYVLEQLDFASLEEAGYLYELWSVSPQDGSKDVIAASGGSHDFSHAAKSTFNMPTQWTLSIMPEQGWIPRRWLSSGRGRDRGRGADLRTGLRRLARPSTCASVSCRSRASRLTRQGCSPIARSSTSSNAPPAVMRPFR